MIHAQREATIWTVCWTSSVIVFSGAMKIAFYWRGVSFTLEPSKGCFGLSCLHFGCHFYFLTTIAIFFINTGRASPANCFGLFRSSGFIQDHIIVQSPFIQTGTRFCRINRLIRVLIICITPPQQAQISCGRHFISLWNSEASKWRTWLPLIYSWY